MITYANLIKRINKTGSWGAEWESDGTTLLLCCQDCNEDYFIEVDIKRWKMTIGQVIDYILDQYCYPFDPEEHAEEWIEAKYEGANGVPALHELLDDARRIADAFKKLEKALAY